MADTLSLDAAVRFAVDRGASVRLIGDDQQLAAIGAGGMLRDINTPTARCSSPNSTASPTRPKPPPRLPSATATRKRSASTSTTAASTSATSPTPPRMPFTAWVADRTAGLDAIMLAPTRDLVAELNRRARDHRLRHTHARPEVALADGNQASVGDMIITRTNDRRLRLSPTDWVKNGDRWTITAISRRRRPHRPPQHQPADHPAARRLRPGLNRLGYATTIHGAQGVSADTMHGLLTGQESRQQLYTMLTRGRHANHVYLQVVGDGDPHSIIRPETIAPHTDRDPRADPRPRRRPDVRHHSAPRTQRPGHPALRRRPALHRQPEHRRRTNRWTRAVADLDAIDQHIPGLTDEPAWPTLRAHLLRLAADTGDHPLPISSKPQKAATSPPPATRPLSLTGGSRKSPYPPPHRCPGSPTFQPISGNIPSGATI